MEFEQFFEIVNKCFDKVGFSILEKFSCTRKSILNLIYCVFLLATLQICGIFTAIYVCQHMSDLVSSPFAVVNCVVINQANLKFIAIWSRRSEITEIFNSLKPYFPSAVGQRFQRRESFNAIRHQKAFVVNILIYGFISSLSGIAKVSFHHFENEALPHPMLVACNNYQRC